MSNPIDTTHTHTHRHTHHTTRQITHTHNSHLSLSLSPILDSDQRQRVPTDRPYSHTQPASGSATRRRRRLCPQPSISYSQSFSLPLLNSVRPSDRPTDRPRCVHLFRPGTTITITISTTTIIDTRSLCHFRSISSRSTFLLSSSRIARNRIKVPFQCKAAVRPQPRQLALSDHDHLMWTGPHPSIYTNLSVLWLISSSHLSPA